ncbi:hypothetical protein BGZ76_009360 [Entomortierella beljakovae]|nr:hypothetical protein BGZ76_009360 [Entomortierella beljakovae]
MHVTCAQNQGLTTKGKSTSLYCDLHRDIGALSRIMKDQKRKDVTASSTPSSSSGSIHNRSTKRSKSYRESSESEDYDEDEYESDSDEEMEDQTVDDSEEDHRLNKSAYSPSTSSKGSSRNRRSSEVFERRRRELDSESEEIDVDDSEAVLGSSTNSSSAQRKRAKIIKSIPRESPAESQRKRLLMTLDKSKKKQGVSALSNVNLSSLPIRTLGGIGVVSSTPALSNSSNNISGSGAGVETKQKLPGISRYNSINNNSSIVVDIPSNPYATGSSASPSLGSSDRFQGNGINQNTIRGTNEGNGKNLKGLTFSLDPGLDIQNLKGSLATSASSSPVISNFSNSGSPVHTRLVDKQQQQQQQHSPKSSTGADESIRNLQGKITNYEAQVQTMSAQIQQLQQQLASSNSNNSSPSSANNTNSAKNLSALAVANPHTIGLPGQDLQYRFDELLHNHTEEKKRSSTLRQNLREVFGLLQVPLIQNTDGTAEVSLDKIDDYVQVLRDTIVGPDSTPSTGSSTRSLLDVKRRDMVVDRVLKELNNQ